MAESRDRADTWSVRESANGSNVDFCSGWMNPVMWIHLSAPVITSTVNVGRSFIIRAAWLYQG